MVDVPKTRAEEIALLRSVIERSGLSVRSFARDVLIREDRTIFRWLKGEAPIPKLVVQFLTDYDPETSPKD